MQWRKYQLNAAIWIKIKNIFIEQGKQPKLVIQQIKMEKHHAWDSSNDKLCYSMIKDMHHIWVIEKLEKCSIWNTKD